eukprot:CAMPEP_0118929046 /NCGR_PEP_ID=MMETSP1169-20130426/6153_1 /TAXON_ID=36882 /ORGANISM="Pyramimonas obovata, Strain CCMP722" /LENGTH=71 /DNA_ID=CAMNT_0006871165 /DNA_START=910 /DNA_END=1126 /DNA_ORIENTATION=+
MTLFQRGLRGACRREYRLGVEVDGNGAEHGPLLHVVDDKARGQGHVALDLLGKPGEVGGIGIVEHGEEAAV